MSKSQLSFKPATSVVLANWSAKEAGIFQLDGYESIPMPQADLKTEIAFLLHLYETKDAFHQDLQGQTTAIAFRINDPQLPTPHRHFFGLLYKDLMACIRVTPDGYAFDHEIGIWLKPLGYPVNEAVIKSPFNVFQIANRRAPLGF